MASGRRSNHVRYPVLKREIERRMIRICDLAETFEMSRASLSDHINGRGDFRLQDAMRISKYFGIPMERLFAEEEHNET